MATIVHYLSAKIQTDGTAQIIARVTISRGRQWRIPLGVYIDPRRFDNGRIKYPRANQREVDALLAIDRRLSDIDNAITSIALLRPAAEITKEMLVAAAQRPAIAAATPVDSRDFFDLFDAFLAHRDITEHRKAMYRSLKNSLSRFEDYRQAIGYKQWRLDIDTFSLETVEAFERFLRDEHQIAKAMPQLYPYVPKERKFRPPVPRGDNTVINYIKELRAFFNWLNFDGITNNHPFDRYHGRTCRYPTPYYLTLEERDLIANYDLSARPMLAVQRDIFIFQCHIGCRVGDLARLTQSNIVGSWIEYVAQKTIKTKMKTIRVPLTPKALEIIERYKRTPSLPSDPLLPFISEQRYNDAIKDICRICGIDRTVTVIDHPTGRDIRRPIWEIASSHMARRTFIGNIYKQVRDPNLVGSLTGHVEGSRAFARYRDIDDDIKRDIIDIIK